MNVAKNIIHKKFRQIWTAHHTFACLLDLKFEPIVFLEKFIDAGNCVNGAIQLELIPEETHELVGGLFATQLLEIFISAVCGLSVLINFERL